MEPVSGTESKIRGFETRSLTVVAPDQVVVIDGPNTGPGNASSAILTADGILRLPTKTGPFPVGSQPKVPLVSGVDIGLYDLNSVVAVGVPYYLGPFQFEPTTNNQGGPLVPGNIYFNTTNNVEYVFTTAGVWAPVGSGAPAAIKAYFYLINVEGSTIPPNGPNTPDAHGHVLAFDLSAGQGAHDSINVYVNGVLQVDGADYILHEGGVSGDFITFTAPLCAGAVVTVQSYGLPGILFAASAVGANTSGWVFNGTTKTFPIKDMSGTSITPGSSVNCLLVNGGRTIDPMSEFSVSGSNLTFVTAPLPGDDVFLVVGLPITDFVPPPPLTTIDIIGLPLNTAPDPAADYLPMYDGSSAFNKKILLGDISGAGNAASVVNTPAGSVSATTVQAAINELDTEKVPTTRTITAGQGLTGGGTLAADRTVALAINTLTADPTPDIVTDFVLSYDTSASAHKKVALNALPVTAGQVTNIPAGQVAAVSVQSAINELDLEKVPTTRQIIAGQGLTGTGDLSIDRTLALNINALTVDPSPDAANDYVLTYDASATSHKKVLLNQFPSSTTGGSISNVPAGNISATTVQAALNELDTEKVPTTRTITTSTGITGGGDLSANRALTLDINGLTVDAAPDGTVDYVATYDASAGTHKKVLLNSFPPPATLPAANVVNTPAGTIAATTVQAALNELDTEKVPTTRTITAGEGLSGTGDLSANRTLAFNVNGLTADATPDITADFLVSFDTSAVGHKKILLSNLPVAGGKVTNVPAGTIAATTVQAALNELDVDKVPTTRTLTAGIGLTGTGDLSADRTLALNINGLITDAAPDSSADFLATYDTSAATHKKVLLNSLTVGMDINGLTADPTPDVNADFVPTFDVSAGVNKKVLLNNLAVLGTKVVNTPAGTIAATTVQAALNELDTEKVPTTRTLTAGVGLTGTGDLSADRTLALNINGLTVDATPDATADYLVTYDTSAATHKKVLINTMPFTANATTIANTPAGGIAATNIQAAINELDTEKAVIARQIITGTGLTGGGDLSADRTHALNINGLTVDAAPDGTADYVVTYDTSAATHKKVLINTLPTTGGASYLTPTTVKTSAYTAASNEMVLTDTTAGAFTVTLPIAPLHGDRVMLVDSSPTGGKWATNNLTVARNGKLINNAATNLVLSSDLSSMLIYNSATGNWLVNLDPFVQLRDFGAVGDGVADDTVAVQAAANSGKLVIIPAGTYKCNSQITLNRKTCFIGAGEAQSFLDFSASTGTLTNACLFVTGTAAVLTGGLSGTHTLGTKTITFFNPHGLVSGDVFTLTVQTNGSYHAGSAEWRRGEWCEVKTVTSTTVVQVTGGLWDTYTAAEVTASKITPCSTVFRDFTVIGKATTLVPAIRLDLGLRARLINMTATGSRDSAFNIEGHYGTRLTNCTGLKYIPDAGDGESYGFALGGCQDVILTACEGFGDRHGCTIGGCHNVAVQLVNRMVYAIGCKFDSLLNYSADMHPICEECGYINCLLMNGTDIGGDRNRVDGCTISAPPGGKHIDLASCKGPNHIFQNLVLKIRGVPPGTLGQYAILDIGGSGTGFDANCTRGGKLIVRNIKFEYPRANVITGTTQTGGSTTTLKLAATASAVDSFYVGMPIRITKGTNDGAVAYITTYVGSTKIATISATMPTAFNDTTTNYEIAPDLLNGLFLIQAYQAASPARIDLEFTNITSNSWAPNQTWSAIKILRNSTAEQWGTIKLQGVEIPGELWVGDFTELYMENVRVYGSEFNYGVQINNAFGMVNANNLNIFWCKGRALLAGGSTAGRYYFDGCFIDACCSGNEEAFRIDNAAYVYADVTVKRNRGSGRDIDGGLAAGGVVTEFCIAASSSYATSGFSATSVFYSPHYGGKKVTWGTGTVPASGTWAVGDVLERTNPSTGTSPRYKCTVAGTPGTWKGDALTL